MQPRVQNQNEKQMQRNSSFKKVLAFKIVGNALYLFVSIILQLIFAALTALTEDQRMGDNCCQFPNVSSKTFVQ